MALAFDRIPRQRLPELLRAMPKAELHLHIEGTLEPELLFALAKKNGVALAYPSVDALRAAYSFTDLQSFLDIYYAGASVLLHASDFEAMAMAYYARAAADNVVHAELFFDPQTHTARGVSIATVIEGLARARDRAAHELGVTSALILCFLRHLSEDEAMATLDEALPHRAQFIGVGLDSSERGHPPEKFARVFDTLADHNLAALLAAGIRATVNSDDPAYFGGYVNDNFVATFDALPQLGAADAYTLARNSFEASFVDPKAARAMVDRLDAAFARFGA